MTLRSVLRPLPFIVCVGLLSCTSVPETGFGRPKIYRLNPDKRPDVSDPAIAFEYKHYLHGAVTTEEVEARRGNYYTFFWRSADHSPARIRFEYRLSATGFKVHAQEIEVPQAGPGTNVTRFQVTGDEYNRQGPVLAWRVSLIQGGRTVTTRQSYLWE